MSGRSPRDRLSKLFHKRQASEAKTDDNGASASPPASPSAAAGRSSGVRRVSSRRSIRDLVHSKGHGQSKRNSVVVDDGTTTSTQVGAQAAATKAMYPDEDIVRLPSVTHQSDLSADLQQFTNADAQRAMGEEAYSEDVADRNMKRKPVSIPVRQRAGPEQLNGADGTGIPPTASRDQRYSEDMATSTGARNQPISGSARDLPQPLKVNKRAPAANAVDSFGAPVSPVTSNESRSLSHKPDVTDLRQSSDAVRPSGGIVSSYNPKTSVDSERRRIKRTSLDKPLPSRPSDEYADEFQNDRVIRQERGTVGALPSQVQRGSQLADKGVDLKGVVDLSNTQDTTLHEKWATAVTHETIIRDVHEIFHEETTREIHEHHIFHRVLPIIDIEVLPARHFIPVSGGYAEIAEDEVPGQTGRNAQWLIAETVSKMLPKGTHKIVPEHFTARKFQGADGESKEYITPEGFKRTEQWWVHPPTFYEPGAVTSGQTYPFYIGSPDPRDDGIRAKLPGGNVVGLSPTLAEQRRKQMAMGSSAGEFTDVPPPVPTHKIFPADLVDSARAGPAKGRR
ncbi:hypothetical protein LTR78_002044 [Recurvomyces mirabilis]|uniref:Uncharacterized protein n=1 Tax=Recurvomyces mirabilis TaxID=574656 RepID=A0AAE0WUP6_9PEZI|nr:hypothetical protein LTR78_002044 [Recurvomyces mirabilis]KAK5160502.1 hypothetical protein LTS14_001514 [Recurvomyces mirabilis]